MIDNQARLMLDVIELNVDIKYASCRNHKQELIIQRRAMLKAYRDRYIHA